MVLLVLLQLLAKQDTKSAKHIIFPFPDKIFTDFTFIQMILLFTAQQYFQYSNDPSSSSCQPNTAWLSSICLDINFHENILCFATWYVRYIHCNSSSMVHVYFTYYPSNAIKSQQQFILFQSWSRPLPKTLLFLMFAVPSFLIFSCIWSHVKKYLKQSKYDSDSPLWGQHRSSIYSNWMVKESKLSLRFQCKSLTWQWVQLVLT